MVEVIIIAEDPSLTVEAVKALKDAGVTYKLLSMKDKLNSLFAQDEDKDENKDDKAKVEPKHDDKAKPDDKAAPEDKAKPDAKPDDNAPAELSDEDLEALEPPKSVKESFKVEMNGEQLTAAFHPSSSVLYLKHVQKLSESMAEFTLNDMYCKLHTNPNGKVNLNVVHNGKMFTLTDVMVKRGTENLLMIQR